jgi:hypothetical protein
LREAVEVMETEADGKSTAQRDVRDELGVEWFQNVGWQLFFKYWVSIYGSSIFL